MAKGGKKRTSEGQKKSKNLYGERKKGKGCDGKK